MENFYENFQEGTIIKLIIFKEYIKKWIPVFINPKKTGQEINIVDFFAGPGYDKSLKPGSPILTLEAIRYHKNNFKNSKVNLIFNDIKTKFREGLEKNCQQYLNKHPEVKKLINIEYYNEDFEFLFKRIKDNIRKHPSLLFLDQFGIKYISILGEFEKFDKTDFLLFLSSSSIRRFIDTVEVRNILEKSGIQNDDIEKIKNTPYKLIHETVVNILKKNFLGDQEFKLYPFSFKKGANVYGIIFGTKHILGADKFLDIAWKINPDNGRADYDIYDDKTKKQPSLFSELIGKTTVEAFKEELEADILNKKIKNNIDVYQYTIEKGFLPRHAKEVLQKLKKNGKIYYDKKFPLISYENFKKRNKIFYTLLEKKTNPSQTFDVSTIKRKSLLYETKVEYGNWTINHIVGCRHGCKFPCYAMMMAKKFGWVKDYEDWRKPRVVENALELLNKEIPKYKNKINFVHLCFMSDPFMYDFDKNTLIPEIKELTLKIIERLNKEGIKVTTLTKGIYPEEVLDKTRFLQYNEYGITLVSLNNKFKNLFEPYSSPYEERIDSLKKLSDNGIKTWVSIEPYPTPDLDSQAGNIESVLEKISFVDKIIFGKLNYRRLTENNISYNNVWKNNEEFYKNMVKKLINFCKRNNIKYHIKSGTPLSKSKTTNIFKE